MGAVTDAGNRRTRVNSLFIVLWRNFPNGSSNSNWVIDVQDCYVLEVQRRSSGLSLSNWVIGVQEVTFWKSKDVQVDCHSATGSEMHRRRRFGSPKTFQEVLFIF